MTDGGLVVGGLGWPHDEMLVATLRSMGRPSETLGAMNIDALERGRAALPRGQCAPMLYTTGALIRRASERERPFAMLNVQSCGPCRYALFGRGYRHALERLGLPSVEFLEVGQNVQSLFDTLGRFDARRMMDALVVADVLSECAHRLRPYENEPGAIDAAAHVAAREIADRVEAGGDAVAALAAVSSWHDERWSMGPQPLARALIVGEPWSLHVDGDGQLNLPQLLARAGAEVEIAPLGTWLAYLCWQAGQPTFGGDDGRQTDAGLVAAFEARLGESYRAAGAAAGLEGFGLPDMDELTELAAPFITPAIRGGYGHLEIGLALRAKRDRRAHVVISVKSFGCIPSAGISDAILPTALGELPYLSLEVSADGEAARESRIAMRVAAALDSAERELERAREEAGHAVSPRMDPLKLSAGARRHACTLANAISTSVT